MSLLTASVQNKVKSYRIKTMCPKLNVEGKEKLVYNLLLIELIVMMINGLLSKSNEVTWRKYMRSSFLTDFLTPIPYLLSSHGADSIMFYFS